MLHPAPPNSAFKSTGRGPSFSGCLRVLLLWKDTMTKATLNKGKHLTEAGLQFQRFSPLSSWQEHGTVQSDIVLEKTLRVLPLDPKTAKRDCVPHWAQLEHRRPQRSSQQWHTSSYKATPTPLVPLSIGQPFNHMSLWGPYLFRPPQRSNPPWHCDSWFKSIFFS